jgi:diguanylate cyclase
VDLDRLVSAAVEGPTAQVRAVVEALVAEVGVDRSRVLLAELGTTGGAQPDLSRVAAVFASSDDVETLARPLLEALHDLTGLASTYLTYVDEQADHQEIRYSRNTTPDFEMPEGLVVPWADTLCARALAEGRPCSTDVSVSWADSTAAKELGIQTYLSVPVRLADGQLWGTQCGADSQVVEDLEQHLPTLTLFARLIASEVERSAALVEAQRAAELDPLTGCTSRRGIELWLDQARAAAADLAGAAAFVDLDDFKAVNDTHGHAVGDRVLCAVAEELGRHTRDTDLVGRLGGDEFVVAATLAADQVPAFLDRWGSSLEVTVEVDGAPLPVRASVGTALLDPSRVDDLLVQADHAMYAVKSARGR